MHLRSIPLAIAFGSGLVVASAPVGWRYLLCCCLPVLLSFSFCLALVCFTRCIFPLGTSGLPPCAPFIFRVFLSFPLLFSLSFFPFLFLIFSIHLFSCTVSLLPRRLSGVLACVCMHPASDFSTVDIAWPKSLLVFSRYISVS